MKAPAFALPDQNGRIVTLESFRGHKLVLYCYPKADTPGCTKQACGLRDNIGKFHMRKVAVVGVSPDDAHDLKKFEQKYNLPFTLLGDPSTRTLQAYGVWGEKQFMGRRYMGVLRTTFLIDERGYILKRYDNVNPETHADMILVDLAMSAAPTKSVKKTTSKKAVKKKTVKKKVTKKKFVKKITKKPVKKVAKKRVAKNKLAKRKAAKKKK